jgi:hypothetical protein
MLGVLSADDPGGPDAFVGPGGWHADVGDHHVGKFAVHCPEESVLVGAGGLQFEIGLAVDELAQALADQVVVLGEHHPDGSG